MIVFQVSNPAVYSHFRYKNPTVYSHFRYQNPTVYSQFRYQNPTVYSQFRYQVLNSYCQLMYQSPTLYSHITYQIPMSTCVSTIKTVYLCITHPNPTVYWRNKYQILAVNSSYCLLAHQERKQNLTGEFCINNQHPILSIGLSAYPTV